MTNTVPARPPVRTADLFKSWTAVEDAAHGLLAPIVSEEQNEQVLEVIDALMIEIANERAHPLLNLLNLLAERVEAFESVTYPMEPSPPHRMLAFMMDQHDLTQKDLEAAVGIDQGNLSRMLKGTRAFTVAQVKRLSEYFHVSPEVFIA